MTLTATARCPPCRGYTPQLAAGYAAKTNPGCEVVFVSSDRDQAGFDGYYGEIGPEASLSF